MYDKQNWYPTLAVERGVDQFENDVEMRVGSLVYKTLKAIGRSPPITSDGLETKQQQSVGISQSNTQLILSMNEKDVAKRYSACMRYLRHIRDRHSDAWSHLHLYSTPHAECSPQIKLLQAVQQLLTDHDVNRANNKQGG